MTMPIGDRSGEARQNPTVLVCQVLVLPWRECGVLQIEQRKAHGIEKLITEIASHFKAVTHQFRRWHIRHGAQDIELLACRWTKVGKDAVAMARCSQIHGVTSIGRNSLDW